jgi:hypothetical protein
MRQRIGRRQTTDPAGNLYQLERKVYRFDLEVNPRPYGGCPILWESLRYGNWMSSYF